MGLAGPLGGREGAVLQMWSCGCPQILPDLPPRPHLAPPPDAAEGPRSSVQEQRGRGGARAAGWVVLCSASRPSATRSRQVPALDTAKDCCPPGRPLGFRDPRLFSGPSRASNALPDGRLALPRDKPLPDTLWGHLRSWAFLTGYAALCRPLNISDTLFSRLSMRMTSSPPP